MLKANYLFLFYLSTHRHSTGSAVQKGPWGSPGGTVGKLCTVPRDTEVSSRVLLLRLRREGQRRARGDMYRRVLSLGPFNTRLTVSDDHVL
jgi:hypothetical protein